MILKNTDRPPFDVLNENSAAPLVIMAEHAGNAVPDALNGLGMPPDVLRTHIAYDPGAREIGTRLADAFGAFAIFGNYSRLVVDLNREMSSEDLFLKERCGNNIPKNALLTTLDKASRINDIYLPYRNAINGKIFGLLAGGVVPVILSLHSMSPDQPGVVQDIALLFDRDVRLAGYLRDRFAKELPDVVVGMNAPYDANAVRGTLSMHAEPFGLPCVEIEFNQALLANPVRLENCVSCIEAGIREFLKSS